MPQNLRWLLLGHVGLSLGLSILLRIYAGSDYAWSYIAGSITVAVSFVGMAWSSWRMLDPEGAGQKSIAPTVSLIVIKYAVLLGLVYYVTRQDWLRPVGFAVGIFTFSIAALVYAVGDSRKEKLNLGRTF